MDPLTRSRILIVEDEAVVARDIRQQLTELGYEPVGHSARGDSALLLTEQLQPDLVLMDVHLEGAIDGVSVAKAIHDRFAIPVVFLTAFADDETLDRAKLASPYGYITKPFSEQELRRAVELALFMFRAARRLQESERASREGGARLRAVLDATEDSIVTIDAARRIVMANSATVRLFGYSAEEIVGLSIHILMPELDRSRPDGPVVDDQHTGEHEVSGIWREVAGRRKDGTEVPLEVRISELPPEASAGSYIGTMRDITQRRQAAADRDLLEARLLQSQKMEALGRLAGGVAHDFNNLLTVINGRAELALQQLADGHALRAPLVQIHSVGERAARLTQQLLAFSRKQVLQREVVDLIPLVKRLQSLLDRVIGEDVELIVKVPARLGCVMGDGGQIEQVLLNLAVNARDAMATGGVLTIELKDAVVDAALAAAYPPLQPGPHAEIRVRDSGVGMGADTLEQIFEPFFTTKSLGHGTGLGLATVHGIIHQSGGAILVQSALGEGTTFTIYLPQTEVPTETRLSSADATANQGTETVLIVEDEAAVGELVTDLLASAGYTVRTASGGVEALALLSTHEAPVHLVLSDVVMPEMSGPSLATQLSAVRPEIRVLFMSGYAADDFARYGLGVQPHPFLNKPFSATELRRTVRAVLDAPAAERR